MYKGSTYPPDLLMINFHYILYTRTVAALDLGLTI